MNRLHPNLRDPVLDGFTDSVAKSKGRGVGGKTLLLAVVATLSLGWGAVSVFSLIRREFSLPSKEHPPVARPLTGAKIDPEHFQQIRTGMKFEAVEKLLGGPPGFYETLGGFQWEKPPRINAKGELCWIGRTSCITILLDNSGAVVDKEYCIGKRIP